MPSSSPDPKRYEQCVRVFTVFFSALAGFGLKRLADNGLVESEKWLKWESWACFTIAFFLLLRFLFGSANHLWLDFLGDPPVRPKPENPRAMLLDCLCLVVIGWLAVFMCYRSEIYSFLMWNSFLGAVAVMIVAVDRRQRRCWNEKPRQFAEAWFPINLCHAAMGLLAALLYAAFSSDNQVVPRLWLLWGAAFASFLLFLGDLRAQVAVLDSTEFSGGKEMKDKKYESCVRVFTVFFSMLMGFGLKHIADSHWDGLEMERWLCFSIALLVLLRFLFGSANHLWIEYLKNPPKGEKQRRVMLWDCGCLAVIGGLGTCMCYAEGTLHFLLTGMFFGVTGTGLILIDRVIRKKFGGRRPRGFWKGWTIINSLYAVASGAVAVALPSRYPSFKGFTWVDCLLLALALLSLVLLLWDLRNQLRALN